MIVERLELRNFRNIAAATLELSPHFNFLIGPNGAGKTVVLEALHLLLRGRSFRTHRVSLLIRHGERELAVQALCQHPLRGRERISLTKDRGNRTELRVNEEPIKQISAVAGLLPLQVLLPDLADLVFGAPQGRRQWLDWGAFHVKHDYIDVLRRYMRVLRQRNALLRSRDARTLDTWTDRMIEAGDLVIRARTEYLETVREALSSCIGALAPGLEVRARHYPGFEGDSLAEEVGARTPGDVKLGFTQVGPHRADVRLEAGDNAAAGVLSRGQGKLVASAMRIGQAGGLLTDQSRPSLFLIDDVWTELDDDHSARFMRLLDGMGCQILATSTHEPVAARSVAADRVRVFHVKHGEITPARPAQ
ncbi:MAG: DNA replication/repair protein RecF [Gammaproteobacteria bacterium]|nr:DNA replication/repair protein RecF [Gammaproteobacteria bacterium]MDE0450998.1 DNA replication/repair protein RecF [Gammaproteobacteria bacterium]